MICLGCVSVSLWLTRLPLPLGGKARGRRPRVIPAPRARAAVAVGAARAREQGDGGEAGAREERARQDGVERSLRVETRLRDVHRVARALLQLARGFVEAGVAARAGGLVLLLRVEDEVLHHLVAEPRHVL